eukprot:16442325-Heterocapsa_arctica.AAC.1
MYTCACTPVWPPYKSLPKAQQTQAEAKGTYLRGAQRLSEVLFEPSVSGVDTLSEVFRGCSSGENVILPACVLPADSLVSY